MFRPGGSRFAETGRERERDSAKHQTLNALGAHGNAPHAFRARSGRRISCARIVQDMREFELTRRDVLTYKGSYA
jgi:monoamine oxidase